MGRRSSGSGFRRASPSGPTRSTRTAAPPQQPPPSAQQGPSMTSGLGSTLMQGMAFGAGSEVAHQAVRGIMGSGHSESHSQPQTYNEPCYQENQNFMKCLEYNKSDINMCQSYLDLFKQCKGSF